MCKERNLTYESNRHEIDQHYQEAGEDFAQRFSAKPELLDAYKLYFFSEQLRGKSLSELFKKYVWH